MNLYPHQQNMLTWMQTTRRGIVFAEMGLGKTFTSLEYIRQSGQKHHLIVCSKILIQEWINQIKKFYPNNELSYFVLHNDFNKVKNVKLEHLKEYDIVFTTYQFVYQMDKTLNASAKLIKKVKHPWDSRRRVLRFFTTKTLYSNGLIYGIKWNTIFLDECHIATNHKTSTFKSLYSLTYKSLFGLSGTPIKNNKSELFSLLNLLQVKEYQYPYKWPKIEIPQSYFDLFYKLTYEQTNIRLPPLILKTLKLNFSDSDKELYLNYLISLSYLFQVQRNIEKDMATIMKLFTRLRQIALDPLLLCETDIGNDQYKQITNTDTTLTNFNNKKYKQLKKIIENIESRGEKALIFSSFTSYLEKIYDRQPSFLMIRATDSIQRRHQIIHQWKTSPNYTVLMMNNRIGAEGLNLIEANNVIILDTWWNFVYEKQCIARAHRIGQQKPVNVYRMIMSKSIEELMLLKSQDKLGLFEKFKTNKEVHVTPLSFDNLEKMVKQNISMLN
jgi:SNF2 family DNA or RNA helicase